MRCTVSRSHPASHDLEDEEIQVVALREAPQNGMVRCLLAFLDLFELAKPSTLSLIDTKTHLAAKARGHRTHQPSRSNAAGQSYKRRVSDAE